MTLLPRGASHPPKDCVAQPLDELRLCHTRRRPRGASDSQDRLSLNEPIERHRRGGLASRMSRWQLREDGEIEVGVRFAGYIESRHFDPAANGGEANFSTIIRSDLAGPVHSHIACFKASERARERERERRRRAAGRRATSRLRHFLSPRRVPPRRAV